MDLEFREVTLEENNWIREKEKSRLYSDDIVDDSEEVADTISQLGSAAVIMGTAGIFIALLFWMILSRMTTNISADIVLLFAAVIIGPGLWYKSQLKKVQSSNIECKRIREISGRVEKAKLYVADVTMTRSEKIETPTGFAYYIEVVEKNDVMGEAALIHVEKEQYDNFEEGKDAYIVKWSFVDGSEGQDTCELMIR